jgi:hypothetical protein
MVRWLPRWHGSRTEITAQQGGAEARREADRQLREMRRQLPESRRLADSLRAAALRNHWRESMTQLFLGDRSTRQP